MTMGLTDTEALGLRMYVDRLIAGVVAEMRGRIKELEAQLSCKYDAAVYWDGDVIPDIGHANDCTIQHPSGPCSCGAFARLRVKQLPSYGELRKRIAELEAKR